MSKIQIKGYEYGICTHPQGPDSGVYAPEICCPDDLTTYADIVTVDCNPTCVHHKNHNRKD